MKRSFLLILTIFLLFILTKPTFASMVLVEGKELEVVTSTEKGTTLVPLRSIFESLSATVAWDELNQTVTAVKGPTTIELKIGSDIAYQNGNKVRLQIPGKVVNGVTYVPLRFVSEALGTKVHWDGSTQMISIFTPPEGTPIKYAQNIVSSDLKINSLKYYTFGNNIEFILDYQSGEVRNYCFFNPPNGDQYMIVGNQEIQQGSNTISFTTPI